jgi:hypothetical protein
MLRNLRLARVAMALCALISLCRPISSNAATILEMSLGNALPDIQFDGTTLSTIDESNPGDQDTGVLFLGFIDLYGPDILTSTASFSMDGLTKNGQASLINNSLILQNFTGGTYSLWDDNDVLLLAGSLGDSALTGALGNSTGGLFQTTLGTATAGVLQGYVDPNSILLSMNFTSIQDTNSNTPGLRVSLLPIGPTFFFNTDLQPFTADATVDIEASAPEPTSAAMLLIASAFAFAVRLRGARYGNVRCIKPWETH